MGEPVRLYSTYLPRLPPNDLKEPLPPDRTFGLAEDLTEWPPLGDRKLAPPEGLILGPREDLMEDVAPEDRALGLTDDRTLWPPVDPTFALFEYLTAGAPPDVRILRSFFWGLPFRPPAQDVQPSPARLFSTGRYLFFFVIQSI